ncbi:hypothetical protein [Flagellimonas sp.]|uniref:hypothetical protein n=1 Tax=Flagellimonas sp. TaxID=2058762 RepID=UPI003BB1F5B0
MKTKSFISCISLSLAILFASCSDENNPTQQEVDSYPKTILGANAALIELGHQSFEKNLDLEFLELDNQNGFSENEPFLLFPFYTSNSENSNTWTSIPTIKLEKGFKIAYTRPYNAKLSLVVEESTSSAPYQGSINFESLNVIAIKTNALRGLSRDDLDVRNYHELIDYFNLKR